MEEIEEIKNPYENIDEFKAKWWGRYHENGCTLNHIQRLYNLNKITKEDFIAITGEEPQEHTVPLSEMEVLKKENKQLWDTVEMLLKINGFLPSEDPIYQIKE